ncbi:MAG: DNA polymerase III subunit delta' [Rhodospirillaceae bacterium]|jgi:DNA polymerase-3 subunit delta'|nr:DNA polymerase III subunit delta' [Rhodospirillaceae bacterium]MBT3930534.1 DNA polymerase III subunit delta' [Rhodospirillaceae bacterium]MBT4771392.1 DNA polymerase III subunit delta' [Rhodospirillaceae bacterium]MBT5359098.1 DNA polymerase III subunit delta' [Rhodospirillaceae bacterium]MBT5768968.1 DNA polymerase III subunit delta' [Rhodospirillaceae bacterium]
MSDELIERIERPRLETGSLIGHAAARQTLVQARNTGRLAHAWLMTGPAGIGKATLAWRFARLVLAAPDAAVSDDDIETDPTHPDVRKIIAGAHPDCRLIRRSMTKRSPYRFRTEISVEDIRDSSTFLHHTAAMSDWRCLIVDAADEMNLNAQNALLKVLEEPPPRTLILLIAHAPSRLLPTIRSRCRTLPLHPLHTEQVAEVMARTGSELSPDEMQIISDISGGSPGKAIDLARAGGLELYQDLSQLVENLPNIDTEQLHITSDKFAGAAGEAGYRTFLEILNWWMLRRIRTDATSGAGGSALERWLKAWENINELTTRADSVNLDRKQVVLNTFFELSAAAKAA